MHTELGPEFAAELRQYGHIYMRRFRPSEYVMKAYPQSCYPAVLPAARCLQLMLMNNLDPSVAQFPHELVTYGGNGSVFSNWAQYHLVMRYLSLMTDGQTLSLYSGHPLGLFPSPASAPRVCITNGLTVPNYSSKADYERYYALGVSQYGQMTAGSWCYIGPQGIVHGTTITLCSASRRWLQADDLSGGRVFVSSGLGGMSGAQPKAARIAKGIAVIAEMDEKALMKRLRQGWVDERIDSLDALITRLRQARRGAEVVSLAFHGNVVDLWERLAAETDVVVELGSDQTSCHNVLGGGYWPAGLSLAESRALMLSDPAAFKAQVQVSLRRQCAAVATLVKRGMRFFDYGNSFLLEASRAGAPILSAAAAAGAAAAGLSSNFIYPSYVEAFMGDFFSLGFGPFRWVCSSGDRADLLRTDAIAAAVLKRLRTESAEPLPPLVTQLYADNQRWVEQADANQLVVGSQARILYADAAARLAIASEMNAGVRSGLITAPVIISRDHHDCGSVDSPFRETSNIRDGSAFTADMAVQNVIGDACRGATWVSLHNGGGTGWGESINGGFGLVLDGSSDADQRLRQMLHFDVFNGIARRAWSGNPHAIQSVQREMRRLHSSTADGLDGQADSHSGISNSAMSDVSGATLYASGGLNVTLPYQVVGDSDEQ